MSDNTRTTLDTNFKYKLAPKLAMLIPEAAILQKLTPKVSEVEQEGRKFLAPVQLSGEHGFTYGDGSVFTYNDAIAAAYDEAEVQSNPLVLRTRVSLDAADRMASSDTAFLTKMGLRASVMKSSIMKRHEISCLYGQSGIGTISSVSGSSTTRAWVITDATWAPGIWAGLVNAQLDVYTTGVGSKRNSNAVVVVTSVDFANKTINVSGNSTDLSAIVATDDLVFTGSAANDMVGLKKIVSSTSGTIFGINTATYELWRGVSHSVGGQLTFGEVMDGLAKAQAQGGLDETAVLMVSSRTWAKLNSDQAALRDYDKSYESAKAEIGNQAIKFWGSFGQLEVIGHPYLMEGEAISVPKSKVRRIGVTDIGFVETDNGGVFERLEGSAGYQVLAKVNASIFVDCPAQCVYFSGITN